jgi:hypothetical protein
MPLAGKKSSFLRGASRKKNDHRRGIKFKKRRTNKGKIQGYLTPTQPSSSSSSSFPAPPFFFASTSSDQPVERVSPAVVTDPASTSPALSPQLGKGKTPLDSDIDSNTAHFPPGHFKPVERTIQPSVDDSKYYEQGNYVASQHERALEVSRSTSSKPDPHLRNPGSSPVPFQALYRRICESLGNGVWCTQAYSHARAGSAGEGEAGSLEFHTDKEQAAVDFRVVVHCAPQASATTVRDGTMSQIKFKPGVDAVVIHGELLARLSHAVLPQEDNNLSVIFSFAFKDGKGMTAARWIKIKNKIEALSTPESETLLTTGSTGFVLRLPESWGPSTISIGNAIRGRYCC